MYNFSSDKYTLLLKGVNRWSNVRESEKNENDPDEILNPLLDSFNERNKQTNTYPIFQEKLRFNRRIFSAGNPSQFQSRPKYLIILLKRMKYEYSE